MGTNSYSLDDVGYVEVVTHTKRIKGKCPMCETVFDIDFDLKDGQDEYACPCGYFRFDAEYESLSEDNHNVPKETWVKRRKAAEGMDTKLNGSKSNLKDKEITFSYDTDVQDLLDTIHCQLPGIPLDQIMIELDTEDQPDSSSVQKALYRLCVK